MRLFLANTTRCSMWNINVRPKVDGRSTCTLMCRMKPKTKVEVRDILININRTQAAERAEKCVFVPGDLDLWT